MDTHSFYLCPICFEVYDHAGECHGRRRIQCDAGEAGDERRKPIAEGGRFTSRAPRWFLEAVGWSRLRGQSASTDF